MFSKTKWTVTDWNGNTDLVTYWAFSPKFPRPAFPGKYINKKGVYKLVMVSCTDPCEHWSVFWKALTGYYSVVHLPKEEVEEDTAEDF
jgi:hypothetical protein